MAKTQRLNGVLLKRYKRLCELLNLPLPTSDAARSEYFQQVGAAASALSFRRTELVNSLSPEQLQRLDLANTELHQAQRTRKYGLSTARAHS